MKKPVIIMIPTASDVAKTMISVDVRRYAMMPTNNSRAEDKEKAIASFLWMVKPGANIGVIFLPLHHKTLCP
jgi:hypothetical protein